MSNKLNLYRIFKCKTVYADKFAEVQTRQNLYCNVIHVLNLHLE